MRERETRGTINLEFGVTENRRERLLSGKILENRRMMMMIFYRFYSFDIVLAGTTKKDT